MEKVLLIFFCFFSILKADYLISNGEIALFYDGKNNIIKNIRGKIYQSDKIANIEIFLEKDYRIYKARDYYTKVQYLEGKNMFKLDYTVQGQKLSTYIVASNEKRNDLYIYTDLSKVNWMGDYRVLYKISPIELTGNIKEIENSYEYDDMFIKKDKNSKVYLATERELEKFKVRVLEDKLRKRVGERIFIEKKISQNTKGDFLSINFNEENKENNSDFSSILNNELKFWKNQDKKHMYLPKRMIKIMRDFYLLESNDYIQTKLDINRGKERYLNRLRSVYINSIINKDSFDNSFFSEALFEKRLGIEKVYYFYYFIKIAQIRGINLKEDDTIKKIIPDIRLNLEKAYEEIENREGNWKLKSYMFCEFINLLKDIMDPKEIWSNIYSIRDAVEKDLEKEILNSNGIITKYSYIKYLRVLPKDLLLKNIDYLIKKADTPMGVIVKNNSVKYGANLEFALILYENGYTVESDKIFERIGYFYNNSNLKDNITTEKIFLYIENIYYRGLI